MITSTKNDQVKAVIELKKKARARNEQGLFVVEGVRMAAELPKDQVKSIYVSETFAKNPENAAILAEYPGYELVSDQVFAAMSDTQTPQGVLALVRQFSYGMEDLLKNDRPAHLMVLENLQDPGNLGTILRAGEGAGITGLIMSRDTVDLYNPKVIRSTMGSVFRVPFYYTDDLEQTVLDLKARGIRVFAAHLAGKNNYEQEDYTGNTAFLIGNEGNGLTEKLSNLADTWVKIPMAGKVESLNAAIAASILMFETARQRRAYRSDFMDMIGWLVAFVILIGIEAATMALTTIWFAGGALFAFFVAIFGFSVKMQLVVFLVVSFLMLLFTRPLAARFINRETVKTNVDGLIGRKAKVITKIDNNEPSGVAVVNGQEWTARSADDAVTIPVGNHVLIKEVRGVKLIVEPVSETSESQK